MISPNTNDKIPPNSNKSNTFRKKTVSKEDFFNYDPEETINDFKVSEDANFVQAR